MSASNATRLRRERAAGKNSAVATSTPAGVVALSPIAIQDIASSPLNPRKSFDQAALDELAASIRAVGVLQPVLVRERMGSGPEWELVAGERRLRAARLAGLTTIPAVLLDGGSVPAALQASIVENVQRQDLGPIELADAIAALLETGLTQVQVAERLGLSQSRVSHLLSLRGLPDEARRVLVESQLSAAHGEVLARYAPFPAFATALAGYAAETRMSAKVLAKVDFDELLDDDQSRFDELVEQIPYTILERAGCAECPWSAFVAGWCLRPEHLKQVQAEIEAERKAEQAGDSTVRERRASKAVELALAAAHPPAAPHLPPVAPAHGFRTGDRVRAEYLGELDYLIDETAAAAVHLVGDDGKAFWVDTGRGDGHLELVEHAATHTEAALVEPPAPKVTIPKLSDLGYGNVNEIRSGSPAPCRAGACACLGKARDWAGKVVDVCTDPRRQQSLQAQATRARNAENRRRHVEAVSRLEGHMRAVGDIGLREVVLLASALADASRDYVPPDARFAACLSDAAAQLASKSSIDLLKVQLGNAGKALDKLVGQETPLSLIKTLVEAICRQDLAMRFLPEGGASYGALAEWYVGTLPKRTPDGWQPAQKESKP